MKLRVVTYNVKNQDLSSILNKLTEEIINLSIDVILFQEIEEYGKDVIEILKKFGYFYSYASARIIPRGSHGLGIISKYPIVKETVYDLPKKNLLFRSRRRIVLGVDIEKGNALMKICNVHLDTRLNIQDRINQIEPIIEIAKNTNELFIIGGDFNTLPFKYFKNFLPYRKNDQVKSLLAYIADNKLVSENSISLKTFDYRKLKLILDHIFINQGKIVEYKVLTNFANSDHYPVMADIET